MHQHIPCPHGHPSCNGVTCACRACVRAHQQAHVLGQLAEATAQLQAAQAAYWQAVQQAHSAGATYRQLQAHGMHSAPHYMRTLRAQGR